jgi:phytoene dehydrogenase-like protein
LVSVEAEHELQPVYTACLDLALSHLPRPDRPVVFDLEQPRFISVQSQVARLAPADGAVLHALFQTDQRQRVDPRDARERLEHFVDEVQPGWREHLVEQRFYPHLLASSALPLASRHGMRGRPSTRSAALRNVYYAGDWVGPHGFLLDASLASARESAHCILQLGTEAVAA